MASPFTAYFAGIGTVVAALAVGFGGALMLTAPSPSQKEQQSAYEKRVEAARAESKQKTVEPVNAPPSVNVQSNADVSVPVSPNITAATAPNVSTAFSSLNAPAPWPPAAVQSTTQEPPKLAPDPGALQTPIRPAPPAEAAAPTAPQPVMKSRKAQAGGQQVVPPEWKKNEKRDAFAQKKTRKQIVVKQAEPAPIDAEQAEDVVETRTVTTYAPEPRPPLGIFNLLLGGGN